MNQEKALQDILEMVGFLRDHAMTKEEGVTKDELNNQLNGLRTEIAQRLTEVKEDITKEVDQKLLEVKSDIMNPTDGFIGLHKKLDIEFTALRSKYDRVNETVNKILTQFNLQLQ